MSLSFQKHIKIPFFSLERFSCTSAVIQISLYISELFFVFRRIQSCVFFEEPIEVTGIAESKFIDNLIDLHIGEFQSGFDQLHFICDDVVLHALFGFGLEVFADVSV